MASTLIQFRIEKDEKQRSSQILETMGLSLPAYLRGFRCLHISESV